MGEGRSWGGVPWVRGCYGVGRGTWVGGGPMGWGGVPWGGVGVPWGGLWDRQGWGDPKGSGSGGGPMGWPWCWQAPMGAQTSQPSFNSTQLPPSAPPGPDCTPLETPPSPPCAPSPCLNGGTCRQLGEGTFDCACLPGGCWHPWVLLGGAGVPGTGRESLGQVGGPWRWVGVPEGPWKWGVGSLGDCWHGVGVPGVVHGSGWRVLGTGWGVPGTGRGSLVVGEGP